MKAQDLRIGNWVEYELYGVKNIQQIEHTDFEFISDNELRCANPIPLTEEWLVKLGGVPNPYQDRYEFGKIYVHIDKTKGITEMWIDDAPHIKYVHQFQNYVHAKTGEELTIKN